MKNTYFFYINEQGNYDNDNDDSRMVNVDGVVRVGAGDLFKMVPRVRREISHWVAIAVDALGFLWVAQWNRVNFRLSRLLKYSVSVRMRKSGLS